MKLLKILKNIFVKKDSINTSDNSDASTNKFISTSKKELYLKCKQDIEQWIEADRKKFKDKCEYQLKEIYENIDIHNMICPICGCRKSIIKYIDSNFKVNRCSDCDNEWEHKNKPSFGQLFGFDEISEFEYKRFSESRFFLLSITTLINEFEDYTYLGCNDYDEYFEFMSEKVEWIKNKYSTIISMPMEVIHYYSYTHVKNDDYELKKYAFNVKNSYKFCSDYDRYVAEFSPLFKGILKKHFGVKSLYD